MCTVCIGHRKYVSWGKLLNKFMIFGTCWFYPNKRWDQLQGLLSAHTHAGWEPHIAPASPKLESEEIRSSHFSNPDRGQTICSGPTTHAGPGVSWLQCFWPVRIPLLSYQCFPISKLSGCYLDSLLYPSSLAGDYSGKYAWTSSSTVSSGWLSDKSSTTLAITQPSLCHC